MDKEAVAKLIRELEYQIELAHEESINWVHDEAFMSFYEGKESAFRTALMRIKQLAK